MLLEHVSKKEFASVFTTNYGAIVKDFIQVTPLPIRNKFLSPLVCKDETDFWDDQNLTFLQFKMTIDDPNFIRMATMMILLIVFRMTTTIRSV